MRIWRTPPVDWCEGEVGPMAVPLQGTWGRCSVAMGKGR